MRREFSAGGVLVRRLRGRWVVAAVRPAGRKPETWVLPKGLIEPGEAAETAALREVWEETGARGRTLAGLGRIEYWFRWEGERVFKVVTFFLVRYGGGRLGHLSDASKHEVAEVRWVPLDEAPHRLAYRGEREVVGRAAEVLASLEV